MVHIANLAANEGFIDFDFAVQLAAIETILHGQSDTLEHEPCSLLTHSDSAMEFLGTKPVLAIGKLPHGEQPLVQADCRVLKDGPDLDGELSLGMPSFALPKVPGRQETNLVRPAAWTNNLAVLPAPIREVAMQFFGLAK